MIDYRYKNKSLCCGVILLASLLVTPAFAGLSSLFNYNEGKNKTPTLAPMIAKVLPSVVSIRVKGKTKIYDHIPQELRRFFGTGEQAEQPFQGLGSGVIINAEKRYIITNNHVVDHADSIKIILNDGREFDAKLIGKDEESDIALLTVDKATGFTAIILGNSDHLKVGDLALAIGNPFGIGQTVTLGIISALARTGLNKNGFENYIQTDASINQGNSGGALINLHGELIGMNTAIIAPSGGNVGVGFAIPSNIIKNLAEQLIKFGQVKRGTLGIRVNELTAGIAKAFEMNVQKGAFVNEVTKNSAADKAGIRPGDVIITLNGRKIESLGELRTLIATSGADREIKLGIIRGGEAIDLTARLENSNDTSLLAKSLHPALDGAILINSKVNKQPGVLIQAIHQHSNADLSNLQKGDLIIGVNRKRVIDMEGLKNIIKSRPPIIALNILRGNNELYLILK